MDSSNSAEKEERKQPKSLLGRFADHPFECSIKTYKEMKDVMEKKSVRARLLFIAGASLPFSGTSTLIQGILNSYDIPLPKPRELRIYPTAVFIDSVKKDGHFTIFDRKEKECGMLLVALTKQLITKKFTIKEPFEDANQLYKDPEVNTYFRRFCDDLLSFKRDLENDSNRVVAIMKSHCFINFLDITVNKAIYECLFIVGSWCKNGFLLSALDLCYYSWETLQNSLDLSVEHFRGRGYQQEDIHLLKVRSACLFFLSIFEGTFSKQEDKRSRALLVCTHKDELSEDEAQTRECQLPVEIAKYAKTTKYMAPFPNILSINNTEGSSDYNTVRKELIALIEEHLKYSDDIELKHLFFYSYLKSKSQIFLTRKEVNDIGLKCELAESEVSKCLQLLHDSCFLFNIEEYVILDLSRFIDDIDKLYCIQSEAEAEAKHLLNGFENGFISKSLCHYIWDKYSPRLSNFYISILTKVGLVTELRNHTQEYFMPSLRAEYEHESVDGSSESLLVLTDTTIPHHKQCMFVQHFQKSAIVLSSSSYNVLKLQRRQDNVMVKILFCNKFLEVSLDFTYSTLQPSAYGSVYSEVKTSCAHVLNRMREQNVQDTVQFPDFWYRFAVWCPKRDHYITFEMSCQPGEYWCDKCKVYIKEVLMSERASWMTSACTESTLRDKDKLNPSSLLEITKTITSSRQSSGFNAGYLCKYFKELNTKMKLETTSSAEGLSVKHEPSFSAHDQLFHELYTWHCYNRSASRFTLAKEIHNQGYTELAINIEPHLSKLLGTKERDLPISSIAINEIAEWWQSSTDELAKILNVELPNSDITSDDLAMRRDLLQKWSKLNCDRDQSKVLQKLFEDHNYYTYPK